MLLRNFVAVCLITGLFGLMMAKLVAETRREPFARAVFVPGFGMSGLSGP